MITFRQFLTEAIERIKNFDLLYELHSMGKELSIELNKLKSKLVDYFNANGNNFCANLASNLELKILNRLNNMVSDKLYNPIFFGNIEKDINLTTEMIYSVEENILTLLEGNIKQEVVNFLEKLHKFNDKIHDWWRSEKMQY